MKKSLTLIIGLILSFSANAQLQGVLFSEYRMILKNNSISSLQINNPTKEIRSYNLSFIEKQIDKDGKIVDVPDSVALPYSLKKYLRIFPRSIKLAPGESQEVQVQLRVPAMIPNGEYRSYLHFLPLDGNSSHDNQTNGNNGVNFAVKFRVGAAIPLFYRKNTTPSKVTIDNVTLTKSAKGPLLSFIIQRDGTSSTYGDIVVTSTSGGKPITLADLTGNAIYTECPNRKFEFPIVTNTLDCSADGKIKLTITYYDREDKSKPRATIYTTKSVEVMQIK